MESFDVRELGKPDLVRVILFQHRDMRDLIVESGVKAENYDKFIHKIESKTMDRLQDFAEWLLDIRSKEFEGARKLKVLLPDEVWKMYDDMGEENLREQVLLLAALRLLRRRWNATRPKTKPIAGERGPAEVPLQPEGVGLDADSGRA